MRRSGAAYDWSSMEVDDRLLSVKLTQREQGPAICSKVNGKETRWGGDTAQRGRMEVEGAGKEGRSKRERQESGGGWSKARRKPRTG